MTNNEYLIQIFNKHKAKDLYFYSSQISNLKIILRVWSANCFVKILESGSRAKGTAISLGSDVDYLVSLTSNCNENNGGLKSIYDSLYLELQRHYQNVRRQNVSFGILLNSSGSLGGLKVDVTPARKYSGNTNVHSLYVAKKGTWQQTDIQKHINDVSQSGRTNEIKLLKIWRELHKLDFPSIYMEYLVIGNILYNKPKDMSNLSDNFFHILSELAKQNGNLLFSRIEDPANSNNILSDLLSVTEKQNIIRKAKQSLSKQCWKYIVW